jgi:hypothetical protein
MFTRDGRTKKQDRIQENKIEVENEIEIENPKTQENQECEQNQQNFGMLEDIQIEVTPTVQKNTEIHENLEFQSMEDYSGIDIKIMKFKLNNLNISKKQIN